MTQNYQGYTVKAIQRALNKQGYKLKEDGIIGSKTEKAISSFKRKHGWRARPWIGPLTAEALGLKELKKRRTKAMGLFHPGSQ